MGIDHFLDMGRSAINVLGNGIATAMLSKNEGLLTDEEAQPDWEPRKRKPDPCCALSQRAPFRTGKDP